LRYPLRAAHTLTSQQPRTAAQPSSLISLSCPCTCCTHMG
jgi:hypothetical protein